MLHMQYHQIVIFFHRPWVSKNYIQPRYPRQGPGYLHARRMCIESSTAVARLLVLYETHYTFRRMNSQVVGIIFTAALILIFITVSNSHMSPIPKSGLDGGGENNNDTNNGIDSTDKMEYLNLCFRALDELGYSFDNAKRTRDFLISLQQRWQAQMRKSGPVKKRQINKLPSILPRYQQQQQAREPSPAFRRKKSKLEMSGGNDNNNNYKPPSTSIPPTETPLPMPMSMPIAFDESTQPLQQQQQQPQHHHGDIDWIAGSELQMQVFFGHLPNNGGSLASSSAHSSSPPPHPPPTSTAPITPNFLSIASTTDNPNPESSTSQVPNITDDEAGENMTDVGADLPSLSDLETLWGGYDTTDATR